MSKGRSITKRPSRRAYYSVGQKPAPKKWYQKRVGWFGKFGVLALTGALVSFGWGVRATLLDSISPQYNAPQSAAQQLAAQTTVNAPKLADSIINVQPVLDKWAKDHPGEHWGVSVRTLDGLPIDASLNVDDEFAIDGSYRLFLVLPLFAQMNLAKQQQTLLTVNGSQKVLSKCVDLMLKISDNNCGIAASKYVEVWKANKLYKQGGFAHTSFESSPTKLKTSAGDTTQLLAHINGSMLDSSSQNLIMGALQQQIFRSGIPSGCPGCQMADYSGFSGGAVYDAAVVTYSRGKYIVAMYSDNGGGFADVAKLAGQIQQRIQDSIK